jgi:hypothetical protein
MLAATRVAAWKVEPLDLDDPDYVDIRTSASVGASSLRYITLTST